MWFDKFFSVVVAVGTLGAGFTFSVIFSSLENLQNTVDTNAVRHFLIIAWLLFVLAIAIASVSAGLFHYMDFFDYPFGKKVKLLGSLASLVLQLLIVAAFLMSARALKRYDEDSGMASVVMIKIFCCLFIVVWGAQGYKTLSRKD
jgi:amino acid transporter